MMGPSTHPLLKLPLRSQRQQGTDNWGNRLSGRAGVWTQDVDGPRPRGAHWLSPVVAGLCPEQAGQDQPLGRVAHGHQLLVWNLCKDVGGLQGVPLRHGLGGAAEVPEGTRGSIVAALRGVGGVSRGVPVGGGCSGTPQP